MYVINSTGWLKMAFSLKWMLSDPNQLVSNWVNIISLLFIYIKQVF